MLRSATFSFRVAPLHSHSSPFSSLFVFHFSTLLNPSVKCAQFLNNPSRPTLSSPFPLLPATYRQASTKAHKARKNKVIPKTKQTNLQKHLFDSKITRQEQSHTLYQTRFDEDSTRISKSIDTILASKHVGKRKKAILRREKELSESELMVTPSAPPKPSDEDEPDFEKQLEDEAREEIIVDGKTKIIEKVFAERYKNTQFGSVYESPHYKRFLASKDPTTEYGEPGLPYVDPDLFGKRYRGIKNVRHSAAAAIPPSSTVPLRLPGPPAELDTSQYMIQPIIPGVEREPIFHNSPPRPIPQNKRHRRLNASDKELLRTELQEIIRKTRPTLHVNYWITQLKLLRTKHRAEVSAHKKAIRKQVWKELNDQRTRERLRVKPISEAEPTPSTASPAS